MSRKLSFSATNISKLLGVNSRKKFKWVNRMKHGVYFENEGLDMYELFTKNKVKRNFPVKKHNNFPFITGKIEIRFKYINIIFVP